MLSVLISILPALAQDLGPSAAERAAIESGLTLEADGVQVVEVGSGIAVVASATADYSTELPNPALSSRGSATRAWRRASRRRHRS